MRNFCTILLGILIPTFSFSTEVLSQGPLTLKIQLGQMGHKPWDPNASAQVRFNFNNAVHEKPFHFTNKYEILPGYISKWRWDYKNEQYVLTLADIKFHNGRAISSRDFEYTIVRPFISTLNRPERQLLNEIVGLKNLKPGEQFKSGMVPGIKILDDKTIALKLVRPNSFFLYSFGENVPPLVPQEELQEDHYTFRNLPVGCGKFRVTWSDPETSKTILQRIEPTSGKSPQVLEIYNHDNALFNKVDLAVGPGAAALPRDSKDYTWVKSDVPIAVQVIDFNFGDAAVKNSDFRRMLKLAINKEKVVEPYKSMAALSEDLIPSNLSARVSRTSEYDPITAKKIFENLPKKMRDRRYIIYFHGAQQVPLYISTLIDQWKAIGLNFEARGTDSIDFEKKHRDGIMYAYGRVTSFADPLKIFSFYLPTSPNKLTSPKDDKKFLAMYDEINSTESVEGRIEKIRELSDYFRSETRQIPLFENYENFTFGKHVKSVGIENIYTSLDYDLIELQ